MRGAETLILVGQGGKQAFDEIQRITTQYPKINHIEYVTDQDLMVMDLENQAHETMRLTIDGVTESLDVRKIICINIKGLICVDSDSCD